MEYGSRILYNSLGKYLLSKTNQLLDYVEVQLDEVSVSPLLESHNHLNASPETLTPILRRSQSSASTLGRNEVSSSSLPRNESFNCIALGATENEHEDLTPTNSMILTQNAPNNLTDGEETLDEKVLRRCSCVNWHSCGKTGYSTTARVCNKGDQIRISTIHTLHSRSRPSSLVTDYYSSRPIADSDSESGFSEASDSSGRLVNASILFFFIIQTSFFRDFEMLPTRVLEI